MFSTETSWSERVSYGKSGRLSPCKKAANKISRLCGILQSDVDEVSESVECVSCNDLMNKSNF